MRLLWAAIRTEATKFLRAQLSVVTTVMLTFGIGILVSSMLLALNTDDPQLAAKLGALVDPGGWAGYLAMASQVTSVAGLLGFGVVLSWLYGREFADSTITGLFALPVSRAQIAAAKFVVYLAWSVAISVALAVMLLLLGTAFGLGPVPDAAWPAFGIQLGAALLTSLLAAPAAWAATLGRGLLAGIGTIIGIVVVAQVAVLSGIGAWFPFSAPGLWATSAGTAASAGQLALVVPVFLLFAGGTIATWKRLQLDK